MVLGAALNATRAEKLLTRPRAVGLPFSLLNGNRLVDALAGRTGIRISNASSHRLSWTGGISLSRSRHTITSRDPDYAVTMGRRARP
jgi:hypothetical protein